MAQKAIKTKADVLQRIEKIKNDLRNLRDDQTAVPCSDKYDICDNFDWVLDRFEQLEERFK